MNKKLLDAVCNLRTVMNELGDLNNEEIVITVGPMTCALLTQAVAGLYSYIPPIPLEQDLPFGYIGVLGGIHFRMSAEPLFTDEIAVNKHLMMVHSHMLDHQDRLKDHE